MELFNHIEELMLDGDCSDCDEDMAACYNQGYCRYETCPGKQAADPQDDD